jgi:predicted glycogen debranching enzyme
LPVLRSIVDWHLRGTRYGIQVDPADGLLRAGEPGVQLTWMDAKVDDWVVTPRIGKPVEINALWYNALRVLAHLRTLLKEAPGGSADLPVEAGSTRPLPELSNQVKNSFRKRFWYEEGGYLYDVVDGPGGDDRSLRPNQLLAISLSPGLIGKERAGQVLSVVRQHLLTPYGLRTLPPDDPRYHPVYTGSPEQRDAAYHQGTVWTWLLGPYFDAVRAVKGEAAARSEWRHALPRLRAHLADAGLGTISEIFDANEPHHPRGCIAQAWSVAEVLRLAGSLRSQGSGVRGQGSVSVGEPAP